MKRLLPLALALLLPSTARATFFRLPLADCDGASKCPDTTKCYVTAYFDHEGSDWNCGPATYEGHQGSDFGVAGTFGVRPVVAAADGTVLETNDGCPVGAWGSTCGGGLGNFVKLSHADGKITWYGHMQAGTVKVAKGQKVTCGQELGRVGSSGNSTGPHLHFEVEIPGYGPDDPYAGGCGGPFNFWVKQGTYCALPGTTCENACTRQCTGKTCGPDGCGNVCGLCSGGTVCESNGTCSTTVKDDARFDSETIPDGTKVSPGQHFTKTWTFTNTGSTTWTKAAGYGFTYRHGQRFGAAAFTWPGDTESIAPGKQKTWSVSLDAPTAPGTYTGYWSMSHAGSPFGDEVYVQVVVDASAPNDGAVFVEETVLDDTHFTPGATFTKTWTVKNTGSTTWTAAAGYKWKFLRGDALSAPAELTLAANESVPPGGTRVWSAPMKAPASAGTYRGYWQMSKSGTQFGDEVWVQIIVDATASADKDHDGHLPKSAGGDDCDDADPEAYPGHVELCEGKDNDCDGKTDEGATCSSGRTCVAGKCVSGGAGASDAGEGDEGSGSQARPFEGGGGCGCSVPGGPGGTLALALIGALFRRPRRRR